MQGKVMREKHLAHPAFAQLARDLVMAQSLPDHGPAPAGLESNATLWWQMTGETSL